jgi:hypothetical protein
MTPAHSKYWLTVGTAFAMLTFFGIIIFYILVKTYVR